MNEQSFIKRVFSEKKVKDDYAKDIEKLRQDKKNARQSQRLKLQNDGEEIPEELNPDEDETEEEDWPKIEDRFTEMK